MATPISKALDLYTTQAAANATGLSPRRIIQLAETGDLPSITLRDSDTKAPQRVYSADAIEQFIRDRRQRMQARSRKAGGVR